MRYWGEGGHLPFEFGEHVVRCGDVRGSAFFGDGDVFAVSLINAARMRAENRPASAFFRAFCAFEKEGKLAVTKFEVSGKRGFKIRCKLGVNGYDVALSGKAQKMIGRWFHGK